jgi:hypothetical protein
MCLLSQTSLSGDAFDLYKGESNHRFMSPGGSHAQALKVRGATTANNGKDASCHILFLEPIFNDTPK